MNLFETRDAFQNGKLSKQDYIRQMHKHHQVLFDYAKLLQDTEIGRITISEGEVIMTAKGSGLSIACDPVDERIVPLEILNFGAYEARELEMIQQLVEPDSRVWDVGANIGWFSLNLARVFPRCRIWAFEPIPSTFAQLQRNASLNGITNLKAHNFGFSNQNGTLTFYFYPEGSGNASASNLAGAANVQALNCPVRTLDSFAEEHQTSPDFIKCDVEGAELFVFQGAIQTIRRQRPVIFTEMLRKWAVKFNYHPNDIISLLKEVGYTCFVTDGKCLRSLATVDESTPETNFFFLHQERHAMRIEKLADRTARGTMVS